MPLLRLQDSADISPLKKHEELCGYMCAQVPLDLVLHQKECFTEHPRLFIKDESHCPKGFWKKVQSTFSPSEIPGQNCNSNYSLARCCSEETWNFLTIQEPLRSWNQHGPVAQLRASWWRYDVNCGCGLKHQLWRRGDHDDFRLHPTISGHFRTLLWEAAFLMVQFLLY